MKWTDYMVIAAQHSRGSASHWLRYLGKSIDKCGISFSKQDIENLYNNEALTPFQKVSLKFAFEEGSPTRKYIQNLNEKVNVDRILEMRKKYDKNSIKR